MGLIQILHIPGDYFSTTWTRDDLNGEVDTFLKERYEDVPEVLRTIQYEYTNWLAPHSISANQSAEYIKKRYDRAQVTKVLAYFGFRAKAK